MKPVVDITGETYGCLLVLRQQKRAITDKSTTSKWLCRCRCGSEVVVAKNNLRSGNTSSCGCIRIKHGLSKNPLYAVWWEMRERCTNPKHPAWRDYGGRGLTVCKRWLKVENFVADMEDSYPGKGYELDREDNESGYSPSNCRWVTRTENVNNRRNTAYLTCGSTTKPVGDWAREYGIPRNTLYMRVFRYGWSVRKALSTR